MDLNRPSLRLLAALVIVALPPLAAYAAVTTLAGSWLAERGIGNGIQLLIGGAITVVWAGLVAIYASRVAAGEASSMVELVERGAISEADATDALTATQRRLTAALDERNRQIAQLAATVRAAPIADDPAAVARAMAGVARNLTEDPTWVLVVLRSNGMELPAGVYSSDPTTEVEELSEVHGWASTLEAGVPVGESPGGARHAIGPWGGFAVVDVAAGEELRAILMAPWEGRAPPSPADLAFFSLLGQQAATAIEHALLYRRLRVQTDELNRMAAVQSDFLRGVTHDLQTPLTRIRALASELREAVPGGGSARTDLDTIAHQADRLRRMVSQLLAVSRLEVGALTPAQEVFRPEPIIRRTWDALRANRSLDFATSGDAHLVVGDPDRYEQVLWAILDNAVKYSPDGSRISIHLDARADAESANGLHSILSVSDEGAGMDPDAREHAFDQFYRSADARRLAPDGSGVGLYAARGLVRAMGGEVSVESRLGEGTTVTVLLPAELADGDADEPGGPAKRL